MPWHRFLQTSLPALVLVFGEMAILVEVVGPLASAALLVDEPEVPGDRPEVRVSLGPQMTSHGTPSDEGRRAFGHGQRQ